MSPTRETAVALWGRAAVDRALAVPAPVVTLALARDVAARAASLDAVAFARWALERPWPEFCAVVRLCSGMMHDELSVLHLVNGR